MPKEPSQGKIESTSTALVVLDKRGKLTLPPDLTERVRDSLSASLAPRSARAYADAWRAFEDWCTRYGFKAIDATAEAVIAFLQTEADRGFALATINQRVAAIAFIHRLEKDDDSATRNPKVRRVLAGLRRTLGTKQQQKKALTVAHLQRIVPGLGVRDRALLLIGFAAGLRRSELAGLQPSDLKSEARGVLLHLGRTKTDQEGRGAWIAIHRGKHPETCPAAALQAWLNMRPKHLKSLFGLTGKGIADVVKRAVESIGLDPNDFGGHSLRAGMVTEADARGISRSAIRRQGRWRSEKMLDRYTRPEDAFQNNVTEDIGL